MSGYTYMNICRSISHSYTFSIAIGLNKKNEIFSKKIPIIRYKGVKMGVKMNTLTYKVINTFDIYNKKHNALSFQAFSSFTQSLRELSVSALPHINKRIKPDTVYLAPKRLSRNTF